MPAVGDRRPAGPSAGQCRSHAQLGHRRRHRAPRGRAAAAGSAAASSRWPSSRSRWSRSAASGIRLATGGTATHERGQVPRRPVRRGRRRRRSARASAAAQASAAASASAAAGQRARAQASAAAAQRRQAAASASSACPSRRRRRSAPTASPTVTTRATPSTRSRGDAAAAVVNPVVRHPGLRDAQARHRPAARPGRDGHGHQRPHRPGPVPRAPACRSGSATARRRKTSAVAATASNAGGVRPADAAATRWRPGTC